MPKLIKTTGMKDFLVVGKLKSRMSWECKITATYQQRGKDFKDYNTFSCTLDDMDEKLHEALNELRAVNGSETWYSFEANSR